MQAAFTPMLKVILFLTPCCCTLSFFFFFFLIRRSKFHKLQNIFTQTSIKRTALGKTKLPGATCTPDQALFLDKRCFVNAYSPFLNPSAAYHPPQKSRLLVRVLLGVSTLLLGNSSEITAARRRKAAPPGRPRALAPCLRCCRAGASSDVVLEETERCSAPRGRRKRLCLLAEGEHADVKNLFALLAAAEWRGNEN